MDVEIFTICDAATEHAGKLNILGTFNAIQARSFPCVHASCAVALRLRFYQQEKGEHKIRLLFVDADGNNIFPPIDGGANVQVPNTETLSVVNLVVNLQGLKFDRPGDYAVNLDLDGEGIACLPFFVR